MCIKLSTVWLYSRCHWSWQLTSNIQYYTLQTYCCYDRDPFVHVRERFSVCIVHIAVLLSWRLYQLSARQKRAGYTPSKLLGPRHGTIISSGVPNHHDEVTNCGDNNNGTPGITISSVIWYYTPGYIPYPRGYTKSLWLCLRVQFYRAVLW